VTAASELVNIGTALSALTVAAVSVSHFDISPRNSGTIFGLGNTASSIGGLIAVPLSGYIFETTHSWSTVFLLFVAHYILGTGAWLALASDKPLKRRVVETVEVES
jgi:MFS family permease